MRCKHGVSSVNHFLQVDSLLILMHLLDIVDMHVSSPDPSGLQKREPLIIKHWRSVALIRLESVVQLFNHNERAVPILVKQPIVSLAVPFELDIGMMADAGQCFGLDLQGGLGHIHKLDLLLVDSEFELVNDARLGREIHFK